MNSAANKTCEGHRHTQKKKPQNGGNTGGPTTEDKTADLTGESGDALNVTAPK